MTPRSSLKTPSFKPFSSPNKNYGSLKTLGSLVDHTNSWLTVNPYKGCPLGCVYCFREAWHRDDTARQQYSAEEAVTALLAHNEFKAHSTPLSVNISSTDALLPQVRESTFKVMEYLDRRGFRNPFGITTKMKLREEDIKRIRATRNLNVIIFVSLAFLPLSVEPVPTKHRIRNLKNLSDAGIATVLYARPLIAGWNTDDATLVRLLRLGQQYCAAVCVGGLRLTDQIAVKLKSATGTAVLPDQTRSIYRKPLDDHIWQKISRIYRDHALKVPLYRHTSCAVSLLMSQANYNRLFDAATKHCTPYCPTHQQGLCGRG